MNRRWWLAAGIIALLALAASGNSITNGFAYDDNYVIVKDPRTQAISGWWYDFKQTYWASIWGGDGYRPLTRTVFRIQYVFGGKSPLPFHAVNIALHAATAVLVFWMASALLPFAAACVAAALYAVHPVHVEAIANVVGQSELWVALLVTIAMGLYIHGRAAGKVSAGRWIAIGLLYVLGCLFKEHGIVLPALILLAELTIVSDRSPLAQRLARVRMPLMALAAVGLAYYWARSRVVLGGGAGFVPYLPFQMVKFTGTDRVLTAIGVAPEWVRLLLWPARLSTEYAPQQVEIAQGPSIAQLPGLLILIGLLGLLAVSWKRSPAVAFGLGWLIIALLPASNFIIPAGFIIAERTLLLPSVGAMIALAAAVPWIYARVESNRPAQLVLAAGVVVLLALGIGRSVTRNRVWNDNDTLFRQGVIDAPLSYRAHYMLGTHEFEHKRHDAGEKHYWHALRLFPHDPTVMYGLADQYRYANACPLAIPLYKEAFAIGNLLRMSGFGLAICMLEMLDFEGAKRTALTTYRWGGSFRTAREIVRAADAGRDSVAARRARGDTLRPPQLISPKRDLTPSNLPATLQKTRP
jgi:protein O-mannosyl-transferase